MRWSGSSRWRDWLLSFPASGGDARGSSGPTQASMWRAAVLQDRMGHTMVPRTVMRGGPERESSVDTADSVTAAVAVDMVMATTDEAVRKFPMAC